jgi:hypothetical protein
MAAICHGRTRRRLIQVKEPCALINYLIQIKSGVLPCGTKETLG